MAPAGCEPRMIVDTSALLAILFQEPGFEVLVEKLVAAKQVAVGAPTLAEAVLVLRDRAKGDPHRILTRLLKHFRIEIYPFDTRHWQVAGRAFQEFSKGRHPARLNFGDCLAYATAKVAARPLLFVGEDFPKTDLAIA